MILEIHEYPDDRERFFHGLLIGLAISIPMWLGILFLVVRAL